MSDQKKPTHAIYLLQQRQGQSLGDQGLLEFLNLVNDPQCFTLSGTKSLILGAEYLID